MKCRVKHTGPESTFQVVYVIEDVPGETTKPSQLNLPMLYFSFAIRIRQIIEEVFLNM